ncbi:MAG: hypothetical protein J6S23_00915 [Clostridia bacterium]|nr:hypothetical protein [Clostridia bacterium]
MDFKKKINLLFKITAILTVLSTALLTLSFRWCFNSADGYFVTSAPPIIFSILYFGGIIISFVSTFALDKNQIIKTKNEIGKMQIPYIAIATSLAFSVLACNLLSNDSFLSIGSLGIGAFLIYAILCSAKSGYAPSPLKVLLLYASVVFPLLMLFANNTNYLRHINSVENTLTTVFTLSFMSYILYEAKRIHEGAHSRWHFGLMLLTFHSGLSLSTAYIIAYLTKSVDEPIRFLQMIPTFFISFFVVFELLRFINEAETHTQEEWNEIEAPEEIELEVIENSSEESTQ